MESMLGNSNSDYPLFRLQKKVDFYETIGGQPSITNFFQFFSNITSEWSKNSSLAPVQPAG